MTREQKAAAAIGSVIAVALFLMLTWSLIGGLAVLVLGLAGAVAALRVTHPRGRHRPSLASLGLLGTTEAPSRPLSEAELEAHEARLMATYRPREYESLCQAYGTLSGAERRFQVGQRAASWALLVKPPNPRSLWLWDCVYPRPYQDTIRDAEVEFSHGLCDECLQKTCAGARDDA